MVGKLIVSHGNLARELLATVGKIVGDTSGFAALSLSWEDGCDRAEAMIRAQIAELDRGVGVLILADMYGDTPCNAARRVIEPGRVELVSGINLPLIVRLACSPGLPQDVGELAEWAVVKGRKGLQRVTAGEEPDPR
ncbi:MAG TPA: PTS fructose transporter subunit IIA [Thermoanaerobaculia bacterium]|nr:PTS fructose transporter subunit IIA [Thermoanaerobaculia bacterium]